MSLSATFDNFELNGIPHDDWQACRVTSSIDACLVSLIGDRDGDGVVSLRDLHPGAIGGDTFTFDITITNTSPPGGTVLTTFAFQSKFSESPALGSRIGDKLFSAECVPGETDPACDLDTDAANPLIGVKKNGTANGLFGGKIKGICINSSDDYPAILNLGVQNEDLECAGGRTFDFDSNQPVLQAADGDFISPSNIELPKGLLPGESMTMRLVLDAGTDDGALQRAYAPACDDPGLTPAEAETCKASTGPLVGTLLNAGEFRAPELASECLDLNIQPGDNVLEVVNFGDVKIIRDSAGNCVPSFEPFSKNQFLTVPRRNWAFTDILDTRDTYLPGELPTVLTGATGQFSFLDFDQLRPGEMNFFEILRGFGEHGETLDPSCQPGGSREGACGGAPYVPWGEFYAIDPDTGKLIRQEVAGSYGAADYSAGPSLTATVDTGGQSDCRPNRPVMCKTTDPFEPAGQVNPGSAIGASAAAYFSDVVVISDDKTTIANEGGQAGGDRVRFTVNIENTSPAGSNIYLTSFNFQTKQRGLTDINQNDGTSILGRQDLRTGADGTLPVCGSDPYEAQCFDTALGIGRFPNVIGNSLLSSVFAEPDPLDQLFGSPEQAVPGQLEAIKKNGTFQPLMKSDFGAANFICIKSGPQESDQDADGTCSGIPTDGSGNPLGLAPGESQTVRLEMDYGDFRGLILRVAPGTLVDYVSPADDPFGLLALRGDFDCRDQRRLPYCHPDLVGDDWFTSPTSLTDVEFVTVHQPGDAATVMNFEQNFGKLLAMAGFLPTAEFYQDGTQLQVAGEYLNLPGADDDTLNVSITDPADGSVVSGIVDITAAPVGTVAIDQVEFFVNAASVGVDTDGSDGWSASWDTTTGADGDYALAAVASGGGLEATSAMRNVTVSNTLVIQIVEPADSATLTGMVNLVAETAGVSPATDVSFSYQEDAAAAPVPIGSATETSPGVWELLWDTTVVAAGDYLLTATATNAIETVSATIAVEIVALSVAIVAPDDGAVLTGSVELQAEVVSAAAVDSVEFFFQASGEATATSLGTATFDAGQGLWVLDWDTTTVADTPLTKPATQDRLSVLVLASGGTVEDALDVRISNMLTTRIFLPDNQESLVGFQDLEALVSSEFAVTSVRFDLYDISDIDPAILIPFGEASPDGQPIDERKYGRPLGDPDWPTGSPLFAIGEAVSEGATRWVFRGWDTVAVPDGTYGLVATALDAGGRRATYMVETFVVNDLQVMISSPSDGATVGPYVALEARTSGLFPVSDVVFSVGGVDIAAAETSPGSGRWKATWDATTSPDGPYTITATATNSAVDEASASVDVTLDKGGAGLEAFFPFDWSNCTALECSFVDGSSGGPTSWEWDFGDGNTSSQQLPTHTYDTYGIYTVTLTVSDGGSPDTYSRIIPVGNIGIDDFNSQAINDSGSETITWTSALKDFAYQVGDTVAVPVMWKTSVGSAQFSALPEVVLFTPEEADGTDPELVGVAEDGVLFTMTFTEVQFRGDTGVFKGKVNLGIEVDVDYEEDGVVDWESRLGTNVDVTNTDLIDTGDSLFVWITEPNAGDEVGGTVTLAATPLSTVPVSEVEFFVDSESIGLGTPDPDSDRWLIDWNALGLDGVHQLSAVARGAGLVASASPVTITVDNSGMPTPTVTLTADPEIVASGDSSTLDWSSTDATSCEASDGWSGVRGTSGSESTGALTETTAFTLTCDGPGGSAQASVTVTVSGGAAPTVTLTADPDTVNAGNNSLLSWNSTDATSCEASDGWNGARDTSGSESTGLLATTTTYTLTCDGPGGSTQASVTVTVVSLVFTGSSINQGRTWSAVVSVSNAPPNTLISGTWNTGGASNSCTTDSSGSCTITLSGILKRVGSVTWTHTETGQTVTISKP